MKLNTNVVGLGIGGGASALTQIGMRFAKTTIAGTGMPTDIRHTIAKNPGAVGMVVGSLAAGGLFVAKQKSAALGAILGATAASVPGIIMDYLANKPATAALPAAAAPVDGAVKGPMVSQRRHGFGAPTIEVFGAPASVNVSGQSQSHSAPVNLAAFGGGSF